MTAAPCSADSGIGASDSSPAKNPFSQERCASENGALEGMISILGGGVSWFMRTPESLERRRARATSRRHGGAQKSKTFHRGKRDGRRRPSAAARHGPAPPLP